MMGTVREIRMGIWHGIARLSLPKILFILALNGMIMWVVWPAEEEFDMSHLDQPYNR